jgi:hypothetical protein
MLDTEQETQGAPTAEDLADELAAILEVEDWIIPADEPPEVAERARAGVAVLP